MEGKLSGSDVWSQVAVPELGNWLQHPANPQLCAILSTVC